MEHPQAFVSRLLHMCRPRAALVEVDAEVANAVHPRQGVAHVHT